MPRRDEYKEVAHSVPFDKDNRPDLEFVSENVQEAIEEVRDSVLTSASPGFSFGRSGAVSKGAYLLCDTVPSNITGRYVYINNAQINKVFVGTEIVGTYKFGVYYHDGDEINITLVGTVTISADRGGSFEVEWLVPTGKYLAIRVEADSVDIPRNIVAGLELSGTRTV